jgi:LCP family protein required for cell wall assembly
MTDRQDAPDAGVPRPPPQQPLRSDAQARLAARIALSRGARRRRLLLMLAGAMSALVLLVSGSAWALTGYINDHIKRVDAGTTGAGATGPLNILVAGVDPRTGLTHHEEVVLHVGNDVSSNSDTLMLMHVSADRSRVTVVSIPRDSWVNIPGHGMNKINAAYGFGGAKLMVQTVEQATNVTINDYVEVDFLGFVKVIDALGGVNICLPQAVNDPYSGLQLSAGIHHVDGITALAYARDRHSFATSDLARIQDQQRLLSSALTEAIHSGLLTNPVRLSSFISASLSAVTVDQGLNVSALADQMRGISAGDVTFMTVPLANPDYQTPTGELAVQWNAQAAGQLFQALANDQSLATPAPAGPSQAADPAHSSAPPGGSGTASGGSPGGAASGSGAAAPTGSPAGGSGAGSGGRTAAQNACG